MFSIALPYSTAEWLAFISALSVIIFGLGLMILPRYSMSIIGLQAASGSKAGLPEIRGALGGVWAGLGVACILLAQPFTYFALGMAFGFAVLGRIISLVFDRSFSTQTVLAIIYEGAVAVFSLKFALEGLGIG